MKMSVRPSAPGRRSAIPGSSRNGRRFQASWYPPARQRQRHGHSLNGHIHAEETDHGRERGPHDECQCARQRDDDPPYPCRGRRTRSPRGRLDHEHARNMRWSAPRSARRPSSTACEIGIRAITNVAPKALHLLRALVGGHDVIAQHKAYPRPARGSTDEDITFRKSSRSPFEQRKVPLLKWAAPKTRCISGFQSSQTRICGSEQRTDNRANLYRD